MDSHWDYFRFIFEFLFEMAFHWMNSCNSMYLFDQGIYFKEHIFHGICSELLNLLYLFFFYSHPLLFIYLVLNSWNFWSKYSTTIYDLLLDEYSYQIFPHFMFIYVSVLFSILRSFYCWNYNSLWQSVVDSL